MRVSCAGCKRSTRGNNSSTNFCTSLLNCALSFSSFFVVFVDGFVKTVNSRYAAVSFVSSSPSSSLSHLVGFFDNFRDSRCKFLELHQTCYQNGTGDVITSESCPRHPPHNSKTNVYSSWHVFWASKFKKLESRTVLSGTNTRWESINGNMPKPSTISPSFAIKNQRRWNESGICF